MLYYHNARQWHTLLTLPKLFICRFSLSFVRSFFLWVSFVQSCILCSGFCSFTRTFTISFTRTFTGSSTRPFIRPLASQPVSQSVSQVLRTVVISVHAVTTHQRDTSTGSDTCHTRGQRAVGHWRCTVRLPMTSPGTEYFRRPVAGGGYRGMPADDGGQSLTKSKTKDNVYEEQQWDH